MRLFFANSFNVPKGSPFIFFYFAKEWMLKKISKCPPFTVFGIERFSKSNNFCLKIRFSQAQHGISDFCTLYPIFVFFSRPLFFLCDFFRSRKKFSTTYAIVLFFFSRPFHENFKFLKNCPYDFHEILQSFYTQRGPCVCKGIKIVWPGCEKHSQN